MREKGVPENYIRIGEEVEYKGARTRVKSRV